MQPGQLLALPGPSGAPGGGGEAHQHGPPAVLAEGEAVHGRHEPGAHGGLDGIGAAGVLALRGGAMPEARALSSDFEAALTPQPAAAAPFKASGLALQQGAGGQNWIIFEHRCPGSFSNTWGGGGAILRHPWGGVGGGVGQIRSPLTA